MKRLVLTMMTAVLLTAGLFAQSPEKMSYQAVIRNSNNQLVSNQPVGMQISILQGTVNGPAVYVETQTTTTNTNGLVSIEIGTGITNDDFSSIDWENGIYFVKTETDPAGGVNYTITGVSQLLSVPYALHAKTAQILTGTIPETDPVYSASPASAITATDTVNWNNKLDSYTETDPVFSSWDKDYNDLINKPGIPTVPTNVSELTNDSEYISSPSNPSKGDVLTWDGTSWVAGLSGVSLCIAKLADAPTTYATAGNFQFRYSSTSDGGFIEIRAISGYEHMMVFSTKKYSTWYPGGSAAIENYHNTKMISSEWTPVTECADETGWGSRVTLSTYQSYEATMTSMGNGPTLPSPLRSFKIFAAIDGYEQIVIRVEYNVL